MPQIDQKLIHEAVSHLDEILDQHTFAFVQLDRVALIQRMDRIRECAMAAKAILMAGRDDRPA